MAKRIERINELIREIVSKIVHRSVQFPDGALVTITRVSTSSDIHYANIFVTVLSKKEDAARNVLSALRAHIGEIQRKLNRSLRMRPVPRIAFRIDEGEERRERIEKLVGGGTT